MDCGLDVEKIFEVLKGKKLQYICRSCELVDMGFGALYERENHRGRKVTVATYTLHLFGPFRITNLTGTIVGSADLFIPSDNSNRVVDLDIKNSTMFDLRLEENKKLLKDEYVTDVTINDYGDIFIKLSNICISVFVAYSTDDESWRFFETGVNKEHLVRTGKKFELC